MLPIWVYETCPNPLHMVKMLGQATWLENDFSSYLCERLSSITKKGEIESPTLVLDNWWNLGLTFDLSVWTRWGSPIQMVMLVDGHGEGDGHKRDDQVLHIWKKEEREK